MPQGYGAYGARTQSYQEYIKDHDYYEKTKQLKGRRQTPKQRAESIKKQNSRFEQNQVKYKPTPQEKAKAKFGKERSKYLNEYSKNHSEEEIKRELIRKSNANKDGNIVEVPGFKDYLYNRDTDEVYYTGPANPNLATAGEELYSDDPNRFGNKMRAVNDFNKREEEASARRVQERYEQEKNEEAYKNYQNQMLNNDDYLQANRPNEYFRKTVDQREYDASIERTKEYHNKLDKYMQWEKDNYKTPEHFQAVKDWQNGAITDNDLVKAFDNNMEEIDNRFSDLGYNKPSEYLKKQAYEEYKNKWLNNDEYLKANRPNEYFNKMVNQANASGEDVDKKIRDYAKKKSTSIKSNTNNVNLEKNLSKLNQKKLKGFADDNLATDITRYSDEQITKLEKEVGRLESIQTSKGVYGMNGALLKDKNGKYYVITSRNGNLFRLV